MVVNLHAMDIFAVNLFVRIEFIYSFVRYLNFGWNFGNVNTVSVCNRAYIIIAAYKNRDLIIIEVKYQVRYYTTDLRV